MCLTTKQSNWLIAEQDIECYKMLEKWYDTWGNPYYRTPYREWLVRGDIINGKEDFVANGVPHFSPMYIGSGHYYYQIEEGAIHAYQELSKARSEAGLWCMVFKCVIPKGTKYAVGLYGDICAEKMKFVQKI